MGGPPTREQIEQMIAAAFADAEMPGSAPELTCGGIDGPYVVEHFLGKDRDEVASSFSTGLHMEDFLYMTPGAVAYYLPVVLRLMLQPDPDDALWIRLRGFLMPRRGERRADGVLGLDAAQLRAIEAWASHLYEAWRVDPPLCIKVKEALALAVAYRDDAAPGE